MKKTILFIAILLLNGNAIFGQENQSVLWEISGNGLKKSSYLFGTIHVASISLLDTFPQLARTAQNCDFALFESGGLSIGEAPVPVASRQPPLDSLFTPDEYALVDSFFIASPHGSIRPHNNDADLFSMVQYAITINEHSTKPQYDAFDDLVRAKLADAGKPIFHLDIQSDIEKIKEGISYQIFAKFLVLTIKEKASLEDISKKEKTDLDLYSKTMRQPLKLDKKVDEAIENVTVERNAKWIPKIEQQMKQGSCFIAVGLEHLKFQTGLIQLLKNKGYTLNPVNL